MPDDLATGNLSVTLTLLDDPAYAVSADAPTATLTIEDKPYDAWRFARFGAASANDPALTAPDANPAGDGIANLLKYAFNLDPRVPVANPGAALPAAAAVTLDGVPCLVFTYRRDRAHYDLTQTVESSADLQSWSPQPDALVGTDGAVETRRAVIPLTDGGGGGGGSSARFLRLRVSR